MADVIEAVIVLLALILVGWIAYSAVFTRFRRDKLFYIIRKYFQPLDLQSIGISERSFPYRVRADLQRAMDRLAESGVTIHTAYGVSGGAPYDDLNRVACLDTKVLASTKIAPLHFEEVDVGDELPVRCQSNGLWLLAQGPHKFVVLMSATGMQSMMRGKGHGLKFEVAAPNNAEGHQLAQEFFRLLEVAIVKAESYRGKILSLEQDEQAYSGRAAGVRVHRLRMVDREQIILPQKTLDLLDRNIIQFARQRRQLARHRQSTRKGVLFYGPPVTGKTHTIHYLSKALPGHTTLLVSAEQIGLLGEYMTLARLLQPSIVVIEDADLIGRDRAMMQGACQETMLNNLLNEMDGLKEDADILFILTTNRPAMLEGALAGRPGRIDQAIEFPMPDEDGRIKLIRLYSQGIEIPPNLLETIARRASRVSAAFIKELMRRSLQFRLERNGDGPLEIQDADNALQEMLFSGGSLNLKLLGAELPDSAA